MRFNGQEYILGQDRNDHVALRWYRLAADQGNAEAEAKIADVYWQGSAAVARLCSASTSG